MATKITPEYTPYATVKPQGPRDPTEHVSINVPEVRISDAVGKAMSSVGEHGMQALAGATGAVAHAFDNLGSQLDKTGNQLWERAQGLQELQNQNALSKAELEFDKYVATKHAQFDNNKGEAATEDTYKAYVKDLEEQQKKLGQALPPKTLEQYNRSTLKQIGRAGIAAAGHVASETRAVTIATSEAKVNQWKDELSKETDLNRSREITANIEREIHSTQRPARGWSGQIANEAVRKHVGEGYIGQLQNLARTDPWRAMEMLDDPDNRKMWDDKQYVAAKTHILHEMTRLGARNIGNDVQSKDPDADLGKKLEEGDKKAEAEEARTGQKQPDLKEATRQAIKERHHTHNEMVAEERKKNMDLMHGVLSGNGESANGHKPKNEDELYAYGGQKARDAFNKLNETDKKYVKRQMNRIALGLGDITPESEDIREYLRGMAGDDPAQFKDLDLKKYEDLRHQDLVAYEKMQDKMKKEGIKLEDDPHVSRALNMAKINSWIDRKLPENKTKWYAFRGAFSDAIHEAQKQNGYDKPLTADQIHDVVRMTESKITEKKSFLGYKYEQQSEPLYQRIKEVPPDQKADFLKKHPDMTESEMLERYRRKTFQMEWNEKFKGKH